MNDINNSYRMGAGKLLYDARNEKRISLDNICFGLCDEQTYYRIENGIQEPDGLLFANIWERLGVSLYRINIVLSEEETKWFILKEKVGEALKKRDVNEVEKIKQAMEELKGLNNPISSQFLDYLAYAILVMKEGFSEKAYELIKKSVTKTIGNPLTIDYSTKYIGQEEIQLLCSYFIAEHKLNPSRDREIHRNILALIRYCAISIDDYSAATGAMSKLAATECVCFGERADIISIEKAVHVMRNAYAILDMPLLLENLGKSGCENHSQYAKWGKSLNNLIATFGDGYSFREELIYIQIPHINEVCDFIKSARIDKGYSQALTSEGICEPENYSRIEKGRRKPNSNKLKGIITKLNVEWGYYNGIIVTNSYECFLRRIETENTLRMGYDEAGMEKLDLLEAKLDMTIPQNIQYCGELKTTVELGQGKITGSEAVERLLSLLELTNGRGERIRYYSPQESTIMVELARIYRRKLNNPNKAISLSDLYIKNEMRKLIPNMGRIYQFNRVKGGALGDIGKWEEEKEVALSALNYIFESDSAEMIEQFLDLYVEGMEEGNASSEKAKRLLIEAVHMAELYYEQSNVDSLSAYVNKQFNLNGVF
jgi:hypothetical protein